MNDAAVNNSINKLKTQIKIAASVQKMRIKQKQLEDDKEQERIAYRQELLVKLQQVNTNLHLMQERQKLDYQLKEYDALIDQIEKQKILQEIEKKNIFNPAWDAVAALDVAFE